MATEPPPSSPALLDARDQPCVGKQSSAIGRQREVPFFDLYERHSIHSNLHGPGSSE